MVNHIPALDRETIRFAAPSGQITLGRLLLLISLLAAAGYMFYPNLIDVPPAAVWLVIAGAFLWGLSFAAATGYVEIDPHARQASIHSGWLASRVRQLALDAQAQIVVSSGSGASGRVSLATPTDSVALLATSADAATLFAHKLSDRLGAPVVTATSRSNSSARASALLRSMTFAGLACISVGVVWPVMASNNTPRPRRRFDRFRNMPLTYNDAQNLIINDHRYTDGERVLRDLLKSDPKNQGVMNLLAYALSGQGKLDEALDAAKAALRLNPDSGLVVDTVGEMHELRGEYADAVRYYENAIQHEPETENVETRAKLGRTLVAMGRNKDAIPHLQYAASFTDVAVWPKTCRDILTKIGAKLPPANRRVFSVQPSFGRGAIAPAR